MHIADIRVWTDPLSGRGCLVHVEEDTCELELRALGERVLTMTCPSVDAAMATADEWRPTYLPPRERRRIQLADAHSRFRASPTLQSLERRRRKTRSRV